MLDNHVLSLLLDNQCLSFPVLKSSPAVILGERIIALPRAKCDAPFLLAEVRLLDENPRAQCGQFGELRGRENLTNTRVRAEETTKETTNKQTNLNDGPLVPVWSTLFDRLFLKSTDK